MITAEEVKAKTPERFWSKIKFGEKNQCWEWQSTKNDRGYGAFTLAENSGILLLGKSLIVRSHRYIYYCVIGNFDKALCVLHTCDNPSCVNPNHLFIGTQQDNADDKVAKGRNKYVVGSAVGTSKLKEEDIPVIRQMLKNGVTQLSVSKTYGVTKSAIGKIAQCKSWLHVTNIPSPSR